MEYNEFKNIVIEEAKKSGVEDYELYYKSSSSDSVEVFDGKLNSFASDVSGGICLRVISNGKMGYASTEYLCEDEARAIVHRALTNAAFIESDDDVFLYKSGDEYEVINHEHRIPDTDSMIKSALSCYNDAINTDPRVTSSTESGCVSAKTTVSIYNSNGLDLTNTTSLAMSYVSAVVSDGDEMYTGFEFSHEAGSKLSSDAVYKAISTIGATVPQTCTVPVIISNTQMQSLLSTFSPVFSSDNAQKGLSLLNGREGTAVASPCVTIVDDPYFAPELSCPFDAEGVKTKTKTVVENGVLKTLLYNLKTAKKAGVKTTANASKASYASPVGIAPYSFYIKAGEYSFEKLLSLAKNGVYITEIKGLHAGANAVTGDFSLESSGFMIENGKIASPIRSFTVAGNFFELLKKIDAVGHDLRFDIPQGVSSFGSPSVLIDSLTIAGK